MKSDIEIAQEAKMQPIIEVARSLGLSEDDIDLYGKYKAKVSLDVWHRLENEPSGKLVLVTAITPTPAGEGKTTTTVGLGQALNRIGKKAIIALREPSLGPSFGIKGGAKAGREFTKKLKMINNVVHLGDVRTSVLHPGSTTHRQLTDEEQIAAGVMPEAIRLNVGIENIEDIINDIKSALE